MAIVEDVEPHARRHERGKYSVWVGWAMKRKMCGEILVRLS